MTVPTPDHVPLPIRIDLTMTVREDGTREGRPVVRLAMRDVVGAVRHVDLDEHVLLDLITDAMPALRQLMGRPRRREEAARLIAEHEAEHGEITQAEVDALERKS